MIDKSKYVVCISNYGRNYFLRSTTWTWDISRGDKFPTREAAQEALKAARKFMRRDAYRQAEIVEVAAP